MPHALRGVNYDLILTFPHKNFKINRSSFLFIIFIFSGRANYPIIVAGTLKMIDKKYLTKKYERSKITTNNSAQKALLKKGGGERMRKCYWFVLTVLAAGLLLAAPSQADDKAAALLENYEKSGQIKGAGVCDNMLSPIIIMTGPMYDRLIMVTPTDKKNWNVYVVRKQSGDEYFIKEFLPEGKILVRQLIPMDWSAEVMPICYNFWLYIFSPNEPHNCIVKENP